MDVKPAPVRRAVHYRESDGKPMAESDLHVRETIELLVMLSTHFAERGDVYVASNNFLYYEEGQPKSVISPDVYVVFGIAPHPRRVFKLWEERRAPAAVFEVSSRKTWPGLGAKMETCARLGVAEYWLYDPEGDYLDPTLQGFQLTPAGYVRIELDDQGKLPSSVLGLDLDLDGNGRIRLVDARSRRRLLRSREEHQARVRSERKVARMAAAQDALNAELQRLLQENARLRGEGLERDD